MCWLMVVLRSSGLARICAPLAPVNPQDWSIVLVSQSKGSISKRVFVDINGIRQGMIIQSRDNSLPVLLFLHDGPGMPELFLNTTHPAGLKQDFP